LSEEVIRVRMPREGEIIGKVLEMLGADRLMVECEDGNERIVRIPGKLKKRAWVRKGDFIIVKPWEIGGDKRGDMVWRYNKNQIDFLREKGLIRRLSVD